MRNADWSENAELLGQCLDEARFPEVESLVRVLESADADEESRLVLLRLIAPRDMPELMDLAHRLIRSDNPEISSLALQIARKSESQIEQGSEPPVSVEAGALHVDFQTGLEFVWIPPGTFEMGSTRYDRECPVHKVTISEGLY